MAIVLGVCVCAGQTISLSVLARNPNKGLELKISRETESGRGEEGPRKDRRAVDEGRRREAVENGVQGKDGQQKEAVTVCDSLQMHGEFKVSQKTLSCTWS